MINVISCKFMKYQFDNKQIKYFFLFVILSLYHLVKIVNVVAANNKQFQSNEQIIQPKLIIRIELKYYWLIGESNEGWYNYFPASLPHVKLFFYKSFDLKIY